MAYEERPEVEQRDTRSFRSGTVGTIVVRADADPPVDKFLQLCHREPQFESTWRRHSRLATSEQRLANYAARANWTDQEIANLLIAYRRRYGRGCECQRRPIGEAVRSERCRRFRNWHRKLAVSRLSA